ncbi:hypothetical protein PPACK8108_LOCUS2288 [Phakopsora pachyrhizi]|uniref:Uncharacterized protein n=1 Tax=Phakopsora pachyrhizi TaxID=170000 RepID=A0AAV0AK63_PHAPC|nr:hypothetical protein PPACK8108_LOCUS2288 [Phakopsora pachyrhizi]
MVPPPQKNPSSHPPGLTILYAFTAYQRRTARLVWSFMTLIINDLLPHEASPEMVKLQSLIRTRLVRSNLGRLVSKLISTKEEATSFQAALLQAKEPSVVNLQAACRAVLFWKAHTQKTRVLKKEEDLSIISSQDTTPSDKSLKKSLLHSYKFDKRKEYNRKKHLKSLFEHSVNQIQEQRRVDEADWRDSPHSIKTTHNQTISKPLSDLTPTTANHNGNLSSHFNNQLKERSGAHLSEDINEDLFQESSHQTNAKEDWARVDNSKAQLPEDLAICVYRFDQLSFAAQYCTVALRSTRITLSKSTAASSRIYCVMIDLEIQILTSLPKPLIMPTWKI